MYTSPGKNAIRISRLSLDQVQSGSLAAIECSFLQTASKKGKTKTKGSKRKIVDIDAGDDGGIDDEAAVTEPSEAPLAVGETAKRRKQESSNEPKRSNSKTEREPRPEPFPLDVGASPLANGHGPMEDATHFRRTSITELDEDDQEDGADAGSDASSGEWEVFD